VLATAVVALKPAVILGVGGTASALALKNATTTLPVIFLIGSDPVKFGLVASLSRPGGNLTGITSLSNLLPAKQLEILRELVPNATVVGLLVNPENPNAEFDTKDVRAGAELLGLKLIVVNAGTENEINTAIIGLVEHRVAAMLVASDLFFLRRRTQIVTLSARYSIPTMHDRPDYVVAGGLMSYGSNRNDLFRQAGVYAGRVLKGDNPGELPVQQATKFELVSIFKLRKRSISPSRQHYSRAPTRSSSETARVHHAARRRGGCVAGGRAGAATRADTADRCADGLCGERSGCAVLPRGFPGCAREAGVDGWQQSSDRISLGRR
jgi:putative tryptophan/tyrosine transport system substrate-binding protein